VSPKETTNDNHSNMTKVDVVLSVSTIASIWAGFSFNKRHIKDLEGKNALIVNEKENRICGLIKFLEPPKEYKETVIYTEEGNRGGQE